LLLGFVGFATPTTNMPPTKGGKRPPKGGTGSGKGKRVPSTAGGSRVPPKSGSVAGRPAGKKAGKAKRRERWSSFIHKTLSSVHSGKTISSRAMSIMGSFVEDMFERIHGEAVNVAKINQTKTLTAREVQTSARLLLPGELCKHAMSEGTRAVAKYNSMVVNAKQAGGDVNVA
jgi:histone H2B